MLESLLTHFFTMPMFALLAVALFAVMLVVVVRRRIVGRTDVSKRLQALALQRNDYTVLVGMPLASPEEWQSVSKLADEQVTLRSGSVVSYADVCAFVVAYPNNQVVDSELCGLPLPNGLTGLSPSASAALDSIDVADLVSGKKFVQIEYGPSVAHPNDPDHYATTLTNVSSKPIRVKRFAAYSKTDQGWCLHTVTRQFYTAAEFKEWYGLGAADWIAPGESVTDFNNYGARPMIWAYFCRAKSGQHFIAGEVLQ